MKIIGHLGTAFTFLAFFVGDGFMTPLIPRFGVLKSMLGKGNLRQALQDMQADLFLNFEDDLERIKEMYEENKSSPPITHNAPTVASALLWIRQLVQQIEEPMKIFRENKILMSSRVRCF